MSRLVLSPAAIDFGPIAPGCTSADRTITAYNSGPEPVLISRLELAPGVTPELTIDRTLPGIPAPGMGVTIPAGDVLELIVRYRAADLGADSGALQIFEEGAPGPYVIPLRGEGAAEPTRVDSHIQLDRVAADVLFVIDNSCSMDQEQASLTANFSSFLEFAERQAIDYRIAAVTTDMEGLSPASNRPCPAPPLATRPAELPQGACGYFADGSWDRARQDPSWRLVGPLTQPSPTQAFGAIADQGTSGSPAEQGLLAAREALSDPLISGWNRGFLRPSASLAIVFLSDEDDSSPGPVDRYLSFYRSLKGFEHPELFSASAITGEAPNGCATAMAGHRYLELAERTGGAFESICSGDWVARLEELGLAVFGYQTRFPLSNAAVPGSIEVRVNGVVVESRSPSGLVHWTHAAATRSVIFTPIAVPEPGSEIVLRYRSECR